MSILDQDRTQFDEEIKLALLVIRKRFNALPAADQSDLRELFAELASAMGANDDERVESAQRAMEEILNRRPSRFAVMEVPSETAKFSNYVQHIGKRIRELRGAAGMTQEQLAEKSGIAQSYISRLEQGQHAPNALTLEKFAKALGTPLQNFDEHLSDEHVSD